MEALKVIAAVAGMLVLSVVGAVLTVIVQGLDSPDRSRDKHRA